MGFFKNIISNYFSILEAWRICVGNYVYYLHVRISERINNYALK